MKKLLLTITFMLFVGIAMAQEVAYAPTAKQYTSAELNAVTTDTYIAIKNLSRTNNYWYFGSNSQANFANAAVFIWSPVEAGVAGAYYLKKLDGTYMQTSAPKDFGGKDNAAVFTTTAPGVDGTFNGDSDSQGYINGNDDANLVRFTTNGKWINVQNGDNGTPTYNNGTGGWTIHYVYGVEANGEVAPTPTPDPEPAPEPVEGEGKVYFISWKNTGANYITEEADGRMTVQAKSVTKAQFWMFIPTEKENCFYIKNTATGRYMGSCNLTPASASKVTTSATPVEYYVGKTAATSGENANCWFFSSTDCSNYSSESAGPRALNKDGASSYVITWTAGVNNVGSYWKLIETPDLYELCPFDASTAIGSIGASYNIETPAGKNLTIADGNLALVAPDSFDENQEWYFVGASDGTGYHVASASEPATVIGINEGAIVTGENLATKWKVNKGATNGYYYLTNNNTTLKVDGDSLFRFTRLRSAYSRSLKIYNNPCGATSDNYIKKVDIYGEGATGNIIYEANSKPGTWHVVYALDKGEVVKGGEFNIDIILANNAANGLTAIAHFDWNSDGIFETAAPLVIDGTIGTAQVTVPEWAIETRTRMRLRVNSNGLDLAEDEVYGFIYDFHINVVAPTEERTATVGVNASNRGTATLSQVAQSYAYGTTLTAKATPKGDARFVCWREEGVIVSTDAEYTFTVDRNVKLVAYFSPNTQPVDEEDEEENESGIEAVVAAGDITFVVNNNTITAVGECVVTGITLYTADAAVAARSNGNIIDTTNIKEGVYVVSATTLAGYKNCKVYLNK
ncbi:MAG: hypothetical protein IKV07_03875 [Bacteroidaceae bacterium]|nr:hypothetical protein [Bacteroidaceae bacterium]